MLDMSGESLEEFYSQILGFEWPWEVQEIIRDGTTREVQVLVVYAEGEDAYCPTCGKPGTFQNSDGQCDYYLCPNGHHFYKRIGGSH